MDVIEGGGSDRRGALSYALIGLVVVALAAAVVWNQSRGRRQVVATPRPTTSSVPARPPLVLLSSDFQLHTGDGSFLLGLDLRNFNRVPVRVKVRAVPTQVGIDRLAVTVMPKVDGYRLTQGGASGPAGGLLIPAQGAAALLLAGFVDCSAAPQDGAGIPITVDDVDALLDVPLLDGKRWPRLVASYVCKR